jgi:catalase-peroxidase
MTNPGKCPYGHDNKPVVLDSTSTSSSSSSRSNKPKTVRDWWPDSLDLRILHQDPPSARPAHIPHDIASYAINYTAKLDIMALRQDIYTAITTSSAAKWWPADYGHYGPLLVRLAWHSAGTYRTYDGRGGANSGAIRLPPLNSWPDNTNLDKALRYILWPIKRKYFHCISWADLIILAGNVAIESMMMEEGGHGGAVVPAPLLYFSGGRIDAFAPEEDIYWGNESEWLQDHRHPAPPPEEVGIIGEEKKKTLSSGLLEGPLGAVQMGLIYVNPEGPGGHPNILASAKDIRETFRRMGMNDTETVALIAGGHTLHNENNDEQQQHDTTSNISFQSVNFDNDGSNVDGGGITEEEEEDEDSTFKGLDNHRTRQSLIITIATAT